MKLVCSGSKNAPTYYIQKSVRINGKSTTKTIERLGSLDEIKARSGKTEPLVWAYEYAKKLTNAEKEANQNILVKYSSGQLIDKNLRRSCNIGYLFLKKIYHSLGFEKICSTISKKYQFDYDLSEILSMLVYARIIFPNSKKASLSATMDLLEQPKCELHQIYRALEILADENEFIQAELYKNSNEIISRKKDVLYYDCTNFFFEIQNEDDFRKYGVSKEHRPNPIVQMGLFMDSDGIPLTFSIFSGNESEQPSMIPLEKKIIKDFGKADFVVCTDAGLASNANRKFNNIQGRSFVTTQSVKKLKGFLKDFCLSDDGWLLPGSNKKYKLSELDETENYDKIFYKERWINENNLEQRLIVTYSIKYKRYQESIREKQVERAKKYILKPSEISKRKANDPKRFIKQGYCTSEGEIADIAIITLDAEQIKSESMYDGLYAVCTNLETPISTIIQINKRRWEIEECFRIMKTEFKARPVYLSKKKRITAHFLTCFISLIIYKILEKKLGEKYSGYKLIKTLRSMNMMIAPGDGYIPTYTRTDITDLLHGTFGFRTDYQIISQKNMRKILNLVKKEKITT